MKRKLVFVVAVTLALMLPLAAGAQDKKGGDKKMMDKKMDAPMTWTGCLNKGADADHFTFKDDKSGKDVVVMGDAKMLTPHANNHNVTITGAMAKDKDKDVVKVTELKMNSMCK